MSTLQKIVKQLSQNPKRLFLIDGLGALVTAFLTGIVLVYFEAFFGMPNKILYPLALVALCFSIYSFSCFMWLSDNYVPFIRVISTANILYCCAAIIAMLLFFEQLTFWGKYYFISECVVVFSLVFIELKVAAILCKKKA